MIHTVPSSVSPDQSSSAGGAQFSFHTVLVALRCWWHLTMPLGLVLAIGSAMAAFYLSTPQYTASLWLLIRERPRLLIQSHPVDDNQKFVENQVELLRSPFVLEPALSDSAVATTPELANKLDPVEYLRKKLQVRPLGKSDYFELAFTSRSAEKAAIVVNKIGDVYRDLQSRDESKTDSRTIELLQDQQSARQASLKQLRKRLQDLSVQIYGKDGFAAPQEKAPTTNPYAELEQRLITAQVDKETLSARIKAEKELLEKESFEPSPAEVAAEIERFPQLQELRRKLDATRAKLAEHKDKSVDLKRNTLYQQLEKQLRDDETAVEKILTEMRKMAGSEMERFGRARRQNAIAELEAQLRAMTVTVQVWTEQVKDKRVVQKEVAVDSLEYELVKADYERASAFLDAISTRVLAMQTEQQAPQRVEIPRPATIPLQPDAAVPYKQMGMAAIIALFAPFALAVGMELLYRRVSNRQQLETTGGIMVVAEVTTLPARSKSQRKGSPGFDRGRRLYEESIDGLRTYLSLEESLRSVKVLAVTSAVSGEGKTSIAAQLAVSVASATGRPTLLIDGDMRAPDVHRVFSIERSPGLCEVLKGECSVEDAIDTGFGEKLHLLTAGTLDRNPHQLLGNKVLEKLIAKVREQYDNIIIDTPPVLAASEALVMAKCSDAAIVCVRRDFSRLDQVAESVVRLQSAGINAAGAVLSGVPLYQYAYKYGTYYYDRDASSGGGNPAPTLDGSAVSSQEV